MSLFKIIIWSRDDSLFRESSLATVNTRFDGASTRRRAIISLLSANHTVQLLSLKCGGGLSGHINALRKINSFLCPGEKCDGLLMFYPDFPAFHPPSVIKLIFLRTLCKMISRFCKVAGAEFFLDIVDLPIYQSQDLGYRLRLSPSMLKHGEKALFKCAHRLVVPSDWFSTVITKLYAVNREKIKLLHNGLFSQTVSKSFDGTSSLELPPKVKSHVRFFYSGSLDAKYSRAIPLLVDSFMELATPGTELFLAGEGGEWLLDDRYSGSKVFYLGHLGELDCILAGSQMDFGLIPYPEGDYFKNCFPSKLGMYVAADLPVLCSELDETVRFLKKYHRGESRPFDLYATFFRDARELFEKYYEGSAKDGKSNYSWDQMALSAFQVANSVD